MMKLVFEGATSVESRSRPEVQMSEEGVAVDVRVVSESDGIYARISAGEGDVKGIHRIATFRRVLQDEGGAVDYCCIRERNLHAIVRDGDCSDVAGGEKLPEDDDRKRSDSKDESGFTSIRVAGVAHLCCMLQDVFFEART